MMMAMILMQYQPGEEGGKPVLTKKTGAKQRSQKKDVEAEILRNIDEEVI